jgi:hypothetical protein
MSMHALPLPTRASLCQAGNATQVPIRQGGRGCAHHYDTLLPAGVS